MPSELYINVGLTGLVLLATATKSSLPKGPPQVISCHLILLIPTLLVVQWIPSGLVIELLPMPTSAWSRATKISSPGRPPQVMVLRFRLVPAFCPVQLIPSGLVITPYEEALSATATNNSWPAGPPQTTLRHLLSATEFREVQDIPSGLVIIRLPVPDWATATKSSWPAGPPQAILVQLLVDGATCVVQLLWANTHWVNNPIKNKSTILHIQRAAHQNVQTPKSMTYLILIWIFSMSGNQYKLWAHRSNGSAKEMSQ